MRKDYYKRLTKKRYANLARGVCQDGDNRILAYRGKNVLFLIVRKVFRCIKINRIMRDDKMYIDYLAVVTDYTCNLNCKGCGQHTPQIKNLAEDKKTVDMNQVLKDVDKIARVVDGIGCLALATGEGFLNRNICETMDYYASSNKILAMNIPTNGSVLPTDEVLNKMAKYDVTATITAYDVIPEAQRLKMIDVFKKKKIRYALFSNRKWYLHEYLFDVLSSKKDAYKKYELCERHFMLIDGKLYKCVVEATRIKCGIHSENQGDSICVSAATDEELRTFILNKVEIPCLDACYHCRGVVGKLALKIPAGEQL